MNNKETNTKKTNEKNFIKLCNKKMLYIILGIIIFILGIIIWSFFNSDKEVINEINEIVPSEEISDEQLRTTVISLYFINKETGDIEQEFRRIDSKELLENPYNEILNMWMKGSENSKLITGCSGDFKINNVNIEKNCAVLDLSEEFTKKGQYENVSELKIIYCIVDTLTELTEIDSVRILINGEQNVYLGNVNLYEEYYRLGH